MYKCSTGRSPVSGYPREEAHTNPWLRILKFTRQQRPCGLSARAGVSLCSLELRSPLAAVCPPRASSLLCWAALLASWWLQCVWIRESQQVLHLFEISYIQGFLFYIARLQMRKGPWSMGAVGNWNSSFPLLLVACPLEMNPSPVLPERT